MSSPYEILDRKRAGAELSSTELSAAVTGAADGSWSDAQLGAFLMACATRGMSVAETAALTDWMLASGDRWSLSAEVPLVADKHSTGGVGDKVSLVLAPMLASVGVPVAMLTGRGLGHTGGTADKFEGIPGLELSLDRAGALRSLSACGMAIGIATASVAPADRKFYALRNVTGTVRSIPLVVGSILSKKLATGAAAVVFDVKTGSGAFFQQPAEARELAQLLVDTSVRCGVASSALITDMGQPLGVWSGNDQELAEAMRALAGDGPDDLIEVTVALALEMAAQVKLEVTERSLREGLTSGAAREVFDRWALAQGADAKWLAAPSFELATELVHVVRAPRAGVLCAIDTMALGNLLARGGAGRMQADDVLDRGVSLERLAAVGDRLEAGEAMARVYLRHTSASWVQAFDSCFELATEAEPAALILERVTPSPGS